MVLVDINDLMFYCSYDGDCMGDIEQCKICPDYVCIYKDVIEAASISNHEQIHCENE